MLTLANTMPHQCFFARTVRPMNAIHDTTLSLTVFTKRNLVADFLQVKCDTPILHQKWPFCVFEPPFGAMYGDHLRLIRKRIVNFLLVLVELFSLGVMAEALRANISSKSAILLQRGPADPKFQMEGVAPTNHSSSL